MGCIPLDSPEVGVGASADPSPFFLLPEALQLTILEKVDPFTLGKVSCTCQQLQSLVTQEKHPAVSQLWERHCRSLLDPSIIATHLAWGRIISRPAGYDASEVTSFWKCLWADMLQLRMVRWWPGGGLALLSNLQQSESKEEAPALSPEAVTLSLSDSLARTGHTATSVGTWQVIVGGLSREGGPLMDVIIIDLVKFTITRPVIRKGVSEIPLGRFRHSAVPLPPVQGNPRLLLFGGYDMEGREFGMDECYTATISKDGSEVFWNTVKTSGHIPSPRFHHTANIFDSGRKLLVFGGEGSAVDDRLHWTGNESISLEGMDEDQITVAAYVLDLQNMVWDKKKTMGDIPGVRSLHLTTVHENPVTGQERLILVGGFKNAEQRLADMTPYALDLKTFAWEHPELDPEELPPPRHRSAIAKVGNEKVMIVGGGTIIDGTPRLLDDCQALDLRTLRWSQTVAGPIARDGLPEEKLKSNPEVYDRATRAVSKTAGHTVESLLVFGGCIKGVLGVIPVEQVEMLLISTWSGSHEYMHPPAMSSAAQRANGGLHGVGALDLNEDQDWNGQVMGETRGEFDSKRRLPDSQQAMAVLRSEIDTIAGFGPSHGGLVIPLSADREEIGVPPVVPLAEPSCEPVEVPNAVKKEPSSWPIFDLNLPPPMSEEEEQDFLRDAARVEQQALFSAAQGAEQADDVGQSILAKSRLVGSGASTCHPQGVPLGIHPQGFPLGIEHRLGGAAMGIDLQAAPMEERGAASRDGSGPFEKSPRFVELRYSMNEAPTSCREGGDPFGMLTRGLLEPLSKEIDKNGRYINLNTYGDNGPLESATKRARLD